jgi:hypothetical protein
MKTTEVSISEEDQQLLVEFDLITDFLLMILPDLENRFDFVQASAIINALIALNTEKNT